MKDFDFTWKTENGIPLRITVCPEHEEWYCSIDIGKQSYDFVEQLTEKQMDDITEASFKQSQERGLI